MIFVIVIHCHPKHLFRTSLEHHGRPAMASSWVGCAQVGSVGPPYVDVLPGSQVVACSNFLGEDDGNFHGNIMGITIFDGKTMVNHNF